MGEPQYLEVYFPNIDLVQVQKLSFALEKTPDFELDLVSFWSGHCREWMGPQLPHN